MNKMRLYQCPACDCLPVRYKKKPTTQPYCVRCSRPLVKQSKISPGYYWASGLAVAGAFALFLPHILDYLGSRYPQYPLFMGLSEAISTNETSERMVGSLDPNDLLAKLEDADLQWRPQEELLANGATRYVYKRRAGEPDLSVAELRSLVDQPPSFDEEKIEILALISTLREKGARVLLTPTVKKGAAAEWDHRRGVLRIQPQMTEKGSIDFLRVLSHEAIHVAQSCKGGSLRAKPQTLGIPIVNPTKVKQTLNDPVYAQSSKWEQNLEMEAYAAQDKPGVAKRLLEDTCKTS